MTDSFVYIIAKLIDDGFCAPCKVGLSDNPDNRLAEFQTATPFKIGLCERFRLPRRDMAKAVERAFHTTQKQHGLHGEWFNIAPAKARFLMRINIDCFMTNVIKLTPEERSLAWGLILEEGTP